MKSVVVLMAALGVVWPGFVAAQSPLADADAGTVALEVMHPDFDDDSFSLATTAWFLGARFGVGTDADLVVELPFAHVGRERPFVGDASSTGFGNPYIGLVLPRGRTRWEFGARLPLANEDEAIVAGFFSDVTRTEAFLPDVASVRGAATIMGGGSGSVRPHVLLGASVWIPTESAGESELLIDYGVGATFDAERARLVARIDGRGFVTGDGSLAGRTQHQLGLMASYAFGRVRPGISARLTLDSDTREFHPGTYGIWIEVH